MQQTVDAAVNQLEDAAENVDLAEITACGSSSFSSAVAEMAADVATAADLAETAAYGSSFCFAAVADSAEAAMTVVADADANHIFVVLKERRRNSSVSFLSLHPLHLLFFL